MPYYCTVPRCTSMAGKAKNVSFHQFPKDKELAKVWNEVLKRGKPYTKYSKVCSLHFKPEDYTITDLKRNKGHWRTLRKDAIPSQNLPSVTPVSSCQKNKNTESWIPSSMMDSQLHQVAQVIYTQTMLALQASGSADLSMNAEYNEQQTSPNREDSASCSSISSGQFNDTISQIEQLLHKNNLNNESSSDSMSKFNNNDSVNMFSSDNYVKSRAQELGLKQTYKCSECSKCFKDPDVFVLHNRSHMPKKSSTEMVFQKTLSENVCSEKENVDSNSSNNCVSESSTEETLRANPILANLLNSSMPQTNLHKGEEMQRVLDYKNVTSIENQIMAALASNMKNYFRNLMSQAVIPGNKNISNHNESNSVCKMENQEEFTKETHDCNKDVLTDEYDAEQYMSMNSQENFDSKCDNKKVNVSMESTTLGLSENSQNCDFAVKT
ncbi:unnamed protein product [Parnassius apollo]|uniref:(apollo) hypothetical protein n=1 Tax=Parnassius apollo TaxID=110799 RepID=A0A8S3WAR6_PARAO|nr:unnamed protein product [Parnassius apollo]